jgi:CubicO group peptidase (beta-lactamase class C family)
MKRYGYVIWLTLLLTLNIWPCQAASPPRNGPTDAGEVTAFVDEVIGKQLDKQHIAGAAVAIVRDGQLVFAKGYGDADLARCPVVAEQTLFRIGSTSKLFVWTAVMQLAEQGKLDLTADINRYLPDFQIPATYPEPITLLHLMNHTAGFEERNTSGMAHSAEMLLPLDEYLAHYLPARVLPPGEVTAYSNYGAALAGYIVQEVAGIPFDEYVAQNIFQPLAMTHSTFRQPPSPELAADLAVGYVYDGEFQARPFEYFNMAPAGSMSATVTDVAKFMIAHLQDGRYGATRILEEATAQQMHQRSFANDPRLSGFAHGFMDFTLNGQRVLEHGGSTTYFHGLLALFPEHKLGLYVVFNSSNGLAGQRAFFQAFLDHYFPITAPPTPPPPTDFTQQAARFTGYYRTTRFNATADEPHHNFT